MSELNNEASSKSKFSPQNLLFILLVLQFVIAPFYYQPNFGGEGLYLPYNSSVWIVATWIMTAGAILIRRSHTLILPKYWLGLACLPLGALLSGLIIDTINPKEWLTRLGAMIGGYIFFLALFQFRLTSKQIDQSLYIIMSFGMIAATYGMFQINGIEQAYTFIPSSPTNIPIGIFQQVNLQASMMATLLILVFYLVSRPSLNSLSNFTKLTLCITAFAASYTIASSGSRVGLLGACIGIIVLFLGRWRLYRNQKAVFTCILLSTLLGAGLQSSGLNKSAVKFDRAIGGVETDIRWKVYKIASDLFVESPIFGHGLGSFQKAFQEKRKEYQQADKIHLGGAPRFSHPHNEIMFWMIEGGVISLVGILIATATTLIQLTKIGWQRGSGYAALLIPIVLHTQVELPFYISSTHWLLLLFLLFVTFQHTKNEVRTTKLSLSANQLIPLSSLGITVFLNWFLVHAQIANSDLVKYFESKNTDLAYLNRPISSFYFREHALYLYHHKRMIDGINKGDIQPTFEFIGYTENLLQKIPAENYYLLLIEAYHIIGKAKARDKLLEEALYIYETSSRLKLLRQKYQLEQNKNP